MFPKDMLIKVARRGRVILALNFFALLMYTKYYMPSLLLPELAIWEMVKYLFSRLIMQYVSGLGKTGITLYEGNLTV